MTLPTRDEMVERMATCIGHDKTCNVNAILPGSRALGCCCGADEFAERALTAIESVIPVSGILSGECVVSKVDRLGTNASFDDITAMRDGWSYGHRGRRE